jgi:Spy/CpxP family protein refolding chaperone
MKTAFLTLSLMTAGFAFAQQAPAPRPHFGPGGPGGPHGDLEARLTQRLGLTAEQQNKVHTVLAERQVVSKGMMTQMQQAHAAMTAAIKSGDESQIDKANQELASLHQQQSAIHAKGVAKIYAALTPAQQAKVGPHLEMLMGGDGFGPGGPGPRRRMGPPPQGKPAAPAQQQ